MNSTHQDILNIIGDVDDLIFERILAVRANKSELHEAALILIVEHELGIEVCPPSSIRVEALCEIIREVIMDEEDQDDEEEEITTPGLYARTPGGRGNDGR